MDRPHELSDSTKGIHLYERELTKAFAESRRTLRPDGIATIVFASKTTASWEAVLNAVVEAGWVITGSWPIDTEMANKLAALGQARLMSSVHLVCRPRIASQALPTMLNRLVTGATYSKNFQSVSTNGCRDSPTKGWSVRTLSSPV